MDYVVATTMYGKTRFMTSIPTVTAENFMYAASYHNAKIAERIAADYGRSYPDQKFFVVAID